MWRDKKRTPIRWDHKDRDFHNEPEEAYVGVWTNVRFALRDEDEVVHGPSFVFANCEGGRIPNCAIGPLLLPRGVLEIDASPAPEIEERRINTAWKYVLSSRDYCEYRAPYKKVKELCDAGFSIDAIAKKLKVSSGTIDNRLIDIRTHRARSIATPCKLPPAVEGCGRDSGPALTSVRKVQAGRVQAISRINSVSDGSLYHLALTESCRGTRTNLRFPVSKP